MFSIITPSFNSGKYLSEAIESIIIQKGNSSLEYMIFDGDSTDGSDKILEKYFDKIDLVKIEKDFGQANAINKGLKLAKGKIINWLNADDYYEPMALAIAEKNFTDSTHAVAGRSRIFDKNGTKYYSKGTDIYPDNLPKTLGWARIDQPETFFRKEVWDKVGPLNEDLHYVFDREWWIRYLIHFGLDGFKKIQEVLVNFRHHEDSKTIHQKNYFIRESRQLYAAYARHMKEKEIEMAILGSEEIFNTINIEIPIIASKDLIRPMLHYHLLLLGNDYYTQNQKTKAKPLLDMVNEKYMDKSDIRLLRKLKFRNLVPSPLIKMARKFTS